MPVESIAAERESTSLTREEIASRFEAAAAAMARELAKLTEEERIEFERRLTEALDAALRREAESFYEKHAATRNDS